MATQSQLQFDQAKGDQARDRGLDLATSKRRRVLEQARRCAIEAALSRPDGVASADDAVAGLVALGFDEHELGPAAGAVFRDGNWRDTGARIKSTRPSAHSTELRVWKFVGKAPITSQVVRRGISSSSSPATSPKAAAAAGVLPELPELSECPKCGAVTASVLVPVHQGRSLRADCKGCGATKTFPQWDPIPHKFCPEVQQ